MGAEPVPVPVAVVLVPFPAQGHVSATLRLARALAARGVAATVVVPDFVHRRMVGGGCQAGSVDCDGVELASIRSGVADDGGGEPPGFASIAHAMEHHLPASLEEMLVTARARARARARRGSTKGRGAGAEARGVACLVVDILASWAVPVAARCGVPAVGFWPAMLATYRVVAAIPELIGKGLISDSGIPISTKRSNDGEVKVNGDLQAAVADSLHVLPAELELSTAELPWLVGDAACQKARFTFWLRTMERAKTLRSIIVNTFPGESTTAGDDDDITAGPGQQLYPPSQDNVRILEVGPLPTDGFDRSTKGDPPPTAAKNNNPSMWQADASCVEWLDQQRAGSVIYVSFGSWVASIGRGAINGLARGLAAAGRPFLWALKDEPSWREGLPRRYAEAVAGRGKVVAWAPQEDVLRHRAVGCYLTHCGWNSTLEAIQHGARLLCYPVSGDQFINCAYIVKVWGTGIRLRNTRKDTVEDCIKRIMEGEEGRRLQENVERLRERVMLSEVRCDSKRNLDSFIGEIMRDGLELGTLSL